MIDPILARKLVELVEKMGLMRRDMVMKKEIEKYEARLARVEQKLSDLADAVSAEDPELSKQLRTAWHQPARSLAFRNRDHQNDLKHTGAEHKDRPQD
jgi:hypothetical protein